MIFISDGVKIAMATDVESEAIEQSLASDDEQNTTKDTNQKITT
jgi:hypothetical protein